MIVLLGLDEANNLYHRAPLHAQRCVFGDIRRWSVQDAIQAIFAENGGYRFPLLGSSCGYRAESVKEQFKSSGNESQAEWALAVAQHERSPASSFE